MTDQHSIVGTNPATDNLPDSWENRMAQAAVFLGMDANKVEKILIAFGIEKEPSGLQILSDEEITPFGDLRRVFCEDHNISVPKLRMAMKYLRGPKGSETTESIDPESIRLKSKYGIRFKLSNIESAKLIEDYIPENPSHPISIELKKRFGDKSIIAFKPESKLIDIEATANYISDLEQGFPEEETVTIDGVLVRLYAIGKVPNQLIDEDPLFRGSPLKRGRSIVNRVNWLKVSQDARQFVRIAVEMGEIDTDDKRDIRDVIKEAEKGIKSLKETYPEVDLEYREREERDELPKLKMTLEDANGSRKQNPFGIGNRSY